MTPNPRNKDELKQFAVDNEERIREIRFRLLDSDDAYAAVYESPALKLRRFEIAAEELGVSVDQLRSLIGLAPL